MEKNSPLLIVGLGNPGKEYLKTRHNIGAHVVDYFAASVGFPCKLNAKLSGYTNTCLVKGKKCIFLIPTTYMNLSGRAVRKVMEYYNIPVSNILILSDDTYIPFADVRLKMKGSAGGHNGLKDVEERLKTNEYMRLRIGIGEKQTEDLADFVLEKFSQEEESKMDDIAKKCIHVIETKLLEENNQNQIDNKKEDLRRN